MSYDEGLALRIRSILKTTSGLEEKKMFGGVGFILHGNMACGVVQDKLIVRLAPEDHEQALQQPNVLPFDIYGKAMRGWVLVESGGYASNADLQAWVQKGINYALTLPPK